jgi:hypothetical protein
VASVLTIWFGPALIHTLRHAMHRHMGAVVGVSTAALMVLVFYMVRKIFDKRRGVSLPVEEA